MPSDIDPAAAPASDQDRVLAAWNQLNLVLGFFSRIDTRLSAVLALDLGMLALVGSRWTSADVISWRLAVAGLVFAVPLSASFCYLWNAIVPDRRGGTDSLVFFRSIASLPESEFRNRFMNLSQRQLACDLLEQAWRNSRILERKFDSLRSACVGLAFALPGWVWVLVELPDKAH